MNKNYYEILGISKNATQKEIKKAFRCLAKKYHPDVYKGNDAEEKFLEIEEAYQILYNDKKREEYHLNKRSKKVYYASSSGEIIVEEMLFKMADFGVEDSIGIQKEERIKETVIKVLIKQLNKK